MSVNQTINFIFQKLRALWTPTKKNFLWMTVGNGIYAVCQWGMLIVLAKLGSPEVVGQFALALAITAPVILIANMQLRGVQATDARKKYLLLDYMAVRIISSLLALFVILLILIFGHFNQAAFLITLVLALAKVIESLSDVYYGFFQQNEKMELLAKSVIIKGVLSVSVLGVLFYFFQSLAISSLGLVAAWSAVFIFYDTRNAQQLLQRINREEFQGLSKQLINSFLKRRDVLIQIIVLAFPLGIVQGLTSLNINLPRFVIEKSLGARELGIFAALAYTTVAINTFVLALGQAVSPPLSRFFAEGNIPAFKKILFKMIFINISIGLSGVLLIVIGGEPILSLLYSHEYAAYVNLFVILMFAATLSGIGSAFSYAITAARQFFMQIPLFLAVVTTTLVASVVLVPKYKLYGAAGAILISMTVQILGSAWILYRAIKGIQFEAKPPEFPVDEKKPVGIVKT